MSTDKQKLLENFRTKRKEVDEAIKKLREEVKDAFYKEIKSFLKEYPAVEKLEWVQYTPFFMDGDPCEFSAHDMSAFFNDVEFLKLHLTPESLTHKWKQGTPAKTDEELLEYNGPYEGYTPRLFTERTKFYEDMKFVFDLRYELNCRALLALFGDHAHVVIDRNGISVTEHEHD